MTHVDDIRELNPIFLAAVSKKQRFALIPDFIKEIEDKQLKRDLRSIPCGNTTTQQNECWNAEPNNREDALIEKGHPRR